MLSVGGEGAQKERQLFYISITTMTSADGLYGSGKTNKAGEHVHGVANPRTSTAKEQNRKEPQHIIRQHHFHSFCSAAPTICNSIPNSIRSSDTFKSFRRHLRTPFPSSFQYPLMANSTASDSFGTMFAPRCCFPRYFGVFLVF